MGSLRLDVLVVDLLIDYRLKMTVLLLQPTNLVVVDVNQCLDELLYVLLLMNCQLKFVAVVKSLADVEKGRRLILRGQVGQHVKLLLVALSFEKVFLRLSKSCDDAFVFSREGVPGRLAHVFQNLFILLGLCAYKLITIGLRPHLIRHKIKPLFLVIPSCFIAVLINRNAVCILSQRLEQLLDFDMSELLVRVLGMPGKAPLITCIKNEVQLVCANLLHQQSLLLLLLLCEYLLHSSFYLIELVLIVGFLFLFFFPWHEGL